MSDGMRREIEELLDRIEMLTTDDDARTEFVETFADPLERSRVAARLYSLVEPLEEFALAVWPDESTRPAQGARA